MSGEALVNQLSALTGLPESAVSKELLALVKKNGKNIEELRLDDIRHILADYLQDVLLEAKHEYSENFE